LAGQDDEEDMLLLNSFVIFLDPHEVNIDSKTKTNKEKPTTAEKRQTMWNLLKDYGLFPKEILEKDIAFNMMCRCYVNEFFRNTNVEKGSVNTSNSI